MRRDAYICLVLVLACTSVLAQETDDTRASKSGYEDVPGVGGPTSTTVALKRADRTKDPALSIKQWRELLGSTWYSLKKNLNEEKGFAFGVNYNALSQSITGSAEQSNAAAGIFEFLGVWTLTGRGTESTGSIVYLLEHQHRIGSDLSPADLGEAAGSALPTAQFGGDGWNLANLYWSQKIRNGQATVAAGIIDAVDYVNYFPLNDPLTAFSNVAFAGAPTIALPDPGLGAMLRVGKDHFYVSAGVADANAVAGSFDYSGIFDEGELFSHVELGWTPSYARRFIDNMHVTAWHVDAREDQNIPEDWGLAFSFTSRVSETIQPFFRAGYSQGRVALLERSVSVGVGVQLGDFNLLGAGLNWGRTASDDRDQYTAEVFYRFQLLPNVTLTPDVQYISNPALNPEEDNLVILGLRIRITF